MADNACITGADIMNLIMGYQKSQVLMTASALGVFDVLHGYEGPAPVDALADRLAVQPESLERLLNACVALGLLDKCIDANGVVEFDNTTTSSKYLVDKSAMSMKPLIMQNRGMYNLWSQMGDSVRQGGRPVCDPRGGGIFDENKGFCMSEEKQQGFMTCMNIFSRMDAPHVVGAFDLTQFYSACDLGGGSGAMAMEFATWYPHMNVSMMELPHVSKMASRFLPKAQPKNLSLIPGDFMKDDLPDVELFILSHVLHTLSEDNIHKLLRKLYKSLRPGGAMMIMEKTLSENKDGPLNSLLFDLGFLLLADGRERTEEEYRILLEQHGFQDINVKVMPPMCLRDVILARKL